MKTLQEKNIYAHQDLGRLFYLPHTRRYWMIKNDQSWFDGLWNNHDKLFKETWKKEFRFSLETLYFLMNLVRDKMRKSDTPLRKAVALEKRVAVALRCLVTGNPYRTTSKVFGISLSTVMYEFCEAILKISPEFIYFPTNGREQQLQFKSFVHLLRVKCQKLLVLMMAHISKYYVWIHKVEVITFQENNGIQSIPRQWSEQTLCFCI